MPPNGRIGKFELTLEQRGIRFSRSGAPPVPVRPFLSFTLTESGRVPVPFNLVRMIPDGDGLEVMGTTTERVVLNIKLRPSAVGEGIDVELSLENATDPMQIRLSTEFTLTGEAEPRWLVPGFLYGDNQPPGCTRIFPSFSELNRDPRRLVSNFWALRSDRCATPMACAWTYGCFAFIATEEIFGKTNAAPEGIGLSGLRFGCEDGQPFLGCDFPYQEAPAKYSFCHEDKTDPEDIYIYLPEATRMISKFTIGFGEPDMGAYAPVMRSLHGVLAKEHQQPQQLPQEYAEQAAHGGMLRWHYDARQGALYETTLFDHQFGRKRGEQEPAIMHAGWASGCLPAYTLLRAGREGNHPESVTAGTLILNRFASQLSPAGTIFPAWTEEAGWACSFGPDEGSAHSRTVAEAVLFMARAMALELRYNAVHHDWYEAAVSSLNYATGAQREDGALPSYFDLSTGSPLSYEGCAGLAWAAALAAGSLLMNKSHYLDVAQRAGNYYGDFVRKGMLYGMVEDQPMVPTCEDAHWALITYIALYEADRDLKWLDLAKKSADLALTWRFSYNSRFTPESLLGRYGFLTKGGDIQSVANPILGTTGLTSYLELLKLAAYTGDDYYKQRAEDSRLFAQQLIAREEGHWNARAGMVVGGVYHTDWLLAKGMVQPTSNVMAATLIKYVEVSRRQLNLARAGMAPISQAEMNRELGGEKLLYSDVALEENTSPAGRQSGVFGDVSSGMAGLLGLGGGGGMGFGAEEPIAPATSGSRSGVHRRPSMQEIEKMNNMESKILPGLGGGAVSPSRNSGEVPVPNQRTSSGSSAEISRSLTNLMGATLGLTGSSSRVNNPRPLGLGSLDNQAPPSSTPLPFPQSAPSPAPDANQKDGGSSTDEEIKYKIF